MCEVYDGQFHKLIVESEDGWPLTRLQQSMRHFSEIMENNDKDDLLQFIMNYSTINPSDLTDIENTPFRHGKYIEFESVAIHMERFLEGDKFKRITSIETIPVGNFQMKDIVTRHRKVIWNKFWAKRKFPLMCLLLTHQELVTSLLVHLVRSNLDYHLFVVLMSQLVS